MLILVSVSYCPRQGSIFYTWHGMVTNHQLVLAEVQLTVKAAPLPSGYIIYPQYGIGGISRACFGIYCLE